MRVYRQNLHCIIFLQDFDVICCPKKTVFSPFLVKMSIYVGGMENAFLCKTTQLPS